MGEITFTARKDAKTIHHIYETRRVDAENKADPRGPDLKQTPSANTKKKSPNSQN